MNVEYAQALVIPSDSFFTKRFKDKSEHSVPPVSIKYAYFSKVF